MTDGIPLIHADDRIGASGTQPKSPFAPSPPPIVPPSDGIGLQAAAGRKPVAMRAVPSHDRLADEVSKWEISGTIPAKARADLVNHIGNGETAR